MMACPDESLTDSKLFGPCCEDNAISGKILAASLEPWPPAPSLPSIAVQTPTTLTAFLATRGLVRFLG